MVIHLTELRGIALYISACENPLETVKEYRPMLRWLWDGGARSVENSISRNVTVSVRLAYEELEQRRMLSASPMTNIQVESDPGDAEALNHPCQVSSAPSAGS